MEKGGFGDFQHYERVEFATDVEEEWLDIFFH